MAQPVVLYLRDSKARHLVIDRLPFAVLSSDSDLIFLTIHGPGPWSILTILACEGRSAEVESLGYRVIGDLPAGT